MGSRTNVRITYGRRYGLMNFLFDCFMLVITGGLWFVWIFVREMRR